MTNIPLKGGNRVWGKRSPGYPVYVQTILPAEVLRKLKAKLNTEKTGEALSAAVEHYLRCPRV